MKSNWLGGTLSGPKWPISRPTSPIFLTVALLQRTAKLRFVWQKMAVFCLRRVHHNFIEHLVCANIVPMRMKYLLLPKNNCDELLFVQKFVNQWFMLGVTAGCSKL